MSVINTTSTFLYPSHFPALFCHFVCLFNCHMPATPNLKVVLPISVYDTARLPDIEILRKRIKQSRSLLPLVLYKRNGIFHKLSKFGLSLVPPR